MRDDNGYKTSWKRAIERPAGASIHTHIHGSAHCTQDTTEKDHIQAAMLCLERTQIGSTNESQTNTLARKHVNANLLVMQHNLHVMQQDVCLL